MKNMACKPIGEQLLTIGEVASLMSVHTKTVRRLVSRGMLPVVRIGRCLRFRQGDVTKVISEGV